MESRSQQWTVPNRSFLKEIWILWWWFVTWEKNICWGVMRGLCSWLVIPFKKYLSHEGNDVWCLESTIVGNWLFYIYLFIYLFLLYIFLFWGQRLLCGTYQMVASVIGTWVVLSMCESGALLRELFPNTDAWRGLSLPTLKVNLLSEKPKIIYCFNPVNLRATAVTAHFSCCIARGI